MIDEIFDKLNDKSKLTSEELVLLNLIVQIRNHRTIKWDIETISEVVSHFESHLDDLEEEDGDNDPIPDECPLSKVPHDLEKPS